MKYKFILLLLLVYSCNNKPNPTKSTLSSNNSDKFFEIKYEDLLNSKQILSLSQFASNIEYVQLETNSSCLLKRRAGYFFTDSLIFISNEDHILKFSRRGKFLKKIGSPGRGPGEIRFITTMSLIDEKNLIVVQNSPGRELLFYSYDGELVKTIKFGSSIQTLKVLDSENYIAYDDGANGNERYTFRLTNERNDTLSVIHNYTTWKRSSPLMLRLHYQSIQPFYFYNNRCFFKAMFNDTVYSLNAHRIIPSYFFNLGKYKLPTELRAERLGLAEIQRYNEISSDYYYSTEFEVSSKIFIATFSYGQAEPKYLFYDKKNQNGNLLINDSGISTGFVNDWDGGLDFWPVGSINDNQVFKPIDVLNFKKVLDNNNKISFKYPESHSQLIKMISESDVSSNPIIMIVTLKPNF